MGIEITTPEIQSQFVNSSESTVRQGNKVESDKLVNELADTPKRDQIGNEQVSKEEVNDVVIELNSLAQNLQRSLLFSVDEKSGQTFVKVMDKETEETIREIPSKDIREIKAKLGETIGLIFREST